MLTLKFNYISHHSLLLPDSETLNGNHAKALQDGEKELVGLRELGLTDAEIQLWQSRDAADAGDQVQLSEMSKLLGTRSKPERSSCPDHSASPPAGLSHAGRWRLNKRCSRGTTVWASSQLSTIKVLFNKCQPSCQRREVKSL
ncbi:hypothetical protein XENOCAPTIV_009410 [Xenoophorus captivus]|uniref:Uncharacterized protein n=1 Tax=Xenoophorus captivus TaxID=1517983 RepID=A0ABV0SEA1_9TELE